jgi:hypothetical protein
MIKHKLPHIYTRMAKRHVFEENRKIVHMSEEKLVKI